MATDEEWEVAIGAARARDAATTARRTTARREHLRGVIWPREPVAGDQGAPLYRYAIVAMLVTDRPIDGFDANETVLAGPVRGLAELLVAAPRGRATRRLGDATDVLLSLRDSIEDAGGA